MTTPSSDSWAIPREQAIPRLLDQHGGRLFGLSRRICGNPEEAEDLVQEVFVQAWRKWEQFDGRSDPIVWLFTIARRACQRMHRKRSGEPARIASLDELLPFGQPSIAVVSQETPIDAQVRREQREAVEAAITKLPDDYRMPLVLRDIIGFSVAEAATILGLKPATVKTRVHRARLQLRAALESGLPHEDLPPPAYSRQVCLDLLQAKQESLDRGVEMPNANEIICERCKAVFGTLDLTQSVCSSLADEVLPESLRETLVESWNQQDEDS
ncbi:MAG: RNA polymerase sigma factor [Planctomycetes bacterium]|nr:RNA polymerase sigma factor [Planctomycetota bacterium]